MNATVDNLWALAGLPVPSLRAALALAAATTVTGSGRMHLHVTTLNETSSKTRTTAVRRRGTTNSAGGLDDT